MAWCRGRTSDELVSAWTETQSCGSCFFGFVVLVGLGVGVGVLVGLGDLVGDGDVLVGDGVGVVLVGDGVGVVFVDVGDAVGVVVLLVLEPVLGLGVALFDVLPLLVGVAVADVLLLRVGAALVVVPVLVGRLADGLTLADADRRGVVVPAGEVLVGVPLADGDPPVEEALELGLVLPLVLAVPDALTAPLALVEALPLPADRCGPVAACRALRCRPADLPWCWLAVLAVRTAESSRIAALGRLAQAPFVIGGPPSPTRIVVAPKASAPYAPDARSTNPAKAPSANGRTSRTLAVLTFTTLTL